MADEDSAELLATRIPSGRMGESGDIAAAVLFLASEESSFMTGQMMIVDGGRNIG